MRAAGDSQIGYIGTILFEDTIESLIDAIIQRHSMRISSFRLSMTQNPMSPKLYGQNHPQCSKGRVKMIPAEH